MKHSAMSIQAMMMALATSLLHETAFASSQGHVEQQQRLRGRRLVQSEGCIVTKVLIEMAGNMGSKEQWECELQSADAEQSGVHFVTFEGLDDVDLDVEATSGVTTLLAEGAEIVNGSLKVPPGSLKKWDKIDQRGPFENKGNTGGKDKQKNRLLAPVDSKTVLAVRVTALDDATSASSKTLSDDIFGTDGAAVNMVERFNSCSHGQTQMQPATGTNILNGIAEVVINKNVFGVASSDIKNAVLAELKIVIGKEPSSFNHVMLCLPPGTSGGWIAYGYLNSWLTVYNDQWCQYPSTQVHEIGHNLGLNHASEGTEEYGDQTGMMGYSYGSFDTKMCYNPAKSWQLGWYPKQREEVDMTQQNELQRTLVGIIAYDQSGSAPQRVHLKIKGTTSHPQPLYVGFNRDDGFNDGTVEAKDQVTVVGQTGNGKSYLEAKLSPGGQYVIPNYLNDVDLIVKVNAVSTSANPAFADVTIKMDVPPPTPAPTEPPTVAPKEPTQPPTEAPTPPPTVAPTEAPTPPPTVAPTEAPTPPPTVAPKDPNAWDVVVTETFSNGLGIFATTDTKTTKLFQGSMQLKGTTQASTKLGYGVAGYQKLKADFLYNSDAVSVGQGFELETSSDNGGSWQTVQAFTKGADWKSDGTWQRTDIPAWDIASGVEWVHFRISTSFPKLKGKQGSIYIDDFSLQGQ